MNEVTPDQDRLLNEAIDLMIRYQNDPENPVTVDMIRAWRGRGPHHENIWARVSRVHGASGAILNEKQKIERRQSFGFTRRNFMLGGIALGAGATAWSMGPRILLQVRASHMTSTAEMRRIDLPDGSVVTLGPESAIALDFDTERRRVDLLSGMSFFEVARDTNRPFSVAAEMLTVTALGTAFDVSSDAGTVTVSVDHGLVDVSASDALLIDREHLSGGQWISVDPSSRYVQKGSRDTDEIASWRENVIIAEGDTVAALVARIGRWIPGRIVMADQAIANQRVSGIFDLGNPLRALEAVVHPTGAHVRQMSSLLTVISPI